MFHTLAVLPGGWPSGTKAEPPNPRIRLNYRSGSVKVGAVSTAAIAPSVAAMVSANIMPAHPLPHSLGTMNALSLRALLAVILMLASFDVSAQALRVVARVKDEAIT